jgi:hypothetical protein
VADRAVFIADPHLANVAGDPRWSPLMARRG